MQDLSCLVTYIYGYYPGYIITDYKIKEIPKMNQTISKFYNLRFHKMLISNDHMS